MKVIDPGHLYELDTLDDQGTPVELRFVKREGDIYPGNLGSYGGTIMQEVLRALIDRARYVNNQIACPETESAVGLLNAALVLFELRAARRHDRELIGTVRQIVDGPVCPHCLHIGCPEASS